MTAQVTPIRYAGQTNCVYHRKKILDWFCETCNNVICAECVSTTHKGHNNIILSKVTPDNKMKLKTFIDETEQNGLVQIQEEIDSTQDSLKKHLKQFESLSIEVKEQGEKIKEDVDVLIDKTLSQLKHLEEEDTRFLTTYKSELERTLAERKYQMNQCMETLQNGTDIQVFDTKTGIQSNITLPEKPVLCTADFIPNHDRNRILKQAFGKFIIEQPGHSQGQFEHQQMQNLSGPEAGQPQIAQEQHVLEITLSGHTSGKEITPSKQTQERPSKQTQEKPSKQTQEKPSIQTQEKPSKLTQEKPSIQTQEKPSKQTQEKPSIQTQEKPSKLTQERPSKQTQEKPSIQTSENEIILCTAQTAITPSRHTQTPSLLKDITILSACDVPHITISSCFPNSDDIWTSDRFSNVVIKLTSRGEEKQRISCSVGVTDICISPSTKNFWICSNEDNSVMEQESGTATLTHRFNTRVEPRCLCVKRDGLVLVGMKHCIEEYTPDGKSILATKTSWLWIPSIRSPVKISQCPVSGNVAVVDLDKSSDGGKDKAVVVVMDTHLQELHRYGQTQHKSNARAAPFTPLDLTYDASGNLVVTDFDNKCLHLLSGDGQYLRQLHTDHDMPCAICVDDKGVLWVGFGGSAFIPNKLKRIQHTGD